MFTLGCFFQPKELIKLVFIKQELIFNSELYAAVQEPPASGFQSILLAAMT